MAITRRTFTGLVLGAAAWALCPIRRLAGHTVRRVRYAETPQNSQYRGKVVPLRPEQIAKTGRWLG